MRVKEEDNQPMQFILKGITHSAGSRVFAFDGISANSARIAFSVSADLALSRTHGISIQELPLLCIQLLQQKDADSPDRHLAFAQEDMRRYREEAAARQEASRRKRTPYRQPPRPASQSPHVFP